MSRRADLIVLYSVLIACVCILASFVVWFSGYHEEAIFLILMGCSLMSAAAFICAYEGTQR